MIFYRFFDKFKTHEFNSEDIWLLFYGKKLKKFNHTIYIYIYDLPKSEFKYKVIWSKSLAFPEKYNHINKFDFTIKKK